MIEDNQKENENQLDSESAGNELVAGDLDAASKSFAEALRISFVVLKVIMFALIGLFVFSGFFTVGPNEQALVLRLGTIRGIGESRLLEPGAHWAFPILEEVIKIPVKEVLPLPIDSFWYFEAYRNVPKTLRPDIDGYCITRNESIPGIGENDYNIVHCRWQLNWRIEDPESFFKNIYIRDLKPGESYSDVITESTKSLLESLAGDAIVATMVKYSIDEAITTAKAEIVNDVSKLLQDKLYRIDSGIKVESMQLTSKITWPRQVEQAFQASVKASQASQRLISEAKGYAENTLNEAGGRVAPEIIEALQDDRISEAEKEMLWSKVAGSAQQEITEARAYRMKVVENARANADYLSELLPEYRKRPKLVIQKIYQDAIEYVLDNAEEKIIIQPAIGKKGREFRVLINRDPAITTGARK